MIFNTWVYKIFLCTYTYKTLHYVISTLTYLPLPLLTHYEYLIPSHCLYYRRQKILVHRIGFRIHVHLVIIKHLTSLLCYLPQLHLLILMAVLTYLFIMLFLVSDRLRFNSPVIQVSIELISVFHPISMPCTVPNRNPSWEGSLFIGSSSLASSMGTCGTIYSLIVSHFSPVFKIIVSGENFLLKKNILQNAELTP